MTTTDTDALKERIARAVYENRVSLIESDAERRSWPAWDEHEKADADAWRDMAATVLPIVAGEVRKAKAEALREAAARVLTYPPIDRYGRVMIGARAAAKEIDRLADEYETGDQA